MERPYTTPEGIRTYLTSIEGLHDLRAHRRAAGERRERMPAYCILGRYALTEDGRFGLLTGPCAKPTIEPNAVVTFEEYERSGRRMHGDAWQMSYRTPAPLAPYDGLCPECGRGWTYSEISDVVEERAKTTVLLDGFVGSTYEDVEEAFARSAHGHGTMLEPTPVRLPGRVVRAGECATFLFLQHLHVECHAAESERQRLWWAEDTLERAGYPDVEPSPFMRTEGRLACAWFRCLTPRGAILFGRTASGYGIEWAETGMELPDLFVRPVGRIAGHVVWSEPPVERGPFHIHPKDETYLVDYLARLREALGL